MSFRGRDDRDSKRKYHWTNQDSGTGTKRFHGSNNPREEYHRGVGSRWDRGPKTHDRESFFKPTGISRGSRERTNYSRYPHRNSNKNHHQIFNIEPPVLSGPPKENEESIGPGSEVERLEKVLATKKRIEEALASKSSNFTNKEINFQNSSTSSTGKSKDKESHGPNLDLSLTNRDFTEIGSVGSVIPTEGDAEHQDITINSSSNSTAHQRPQQRSFDNSTSNSSTNLQTSQQKSQKVGGWSMSAMNNIVPEPSKPRSPRLRSDMYLQEQREEILGNISTSAIENTVDPTPNNQLDDCLSKRREEFSRVGRLYQSFLRSRLYGYTLKLKDKAPKLTGPNPLLDKPVEDLNSRQTSVTEDQILELQMPQPIPVKMESNDELNTELTPEHIAAEEANANQFCKEYSFLLKDPNFLIPPEDLEKLGLGYLSAMNKEINDKRSGGTSESHAENPDNFFIRNSGALNSFVGTDRINKDAHPFIRPHSIGQRDVIERFKERDQSLNSNICHNDYISSPDSQNPIQLDQTIRPGFLRNDNSLSAQNLQASPFSNVSVEAVVKKVVKTILRPPGINSVLNSNSTPDRHSNLPKNINESHVSGESGNSFNDKTSNSSNQMQDVSSKILRLFLIDKQVEELMAEKMKIYTELLSSQGISQTLFNSWAQDQIQQGLVMNVISNTSNVIPELSRVINRNPQEANPSQNLNSQSLSDNPLEESLRELYSLKEEFGNSDMANSQIAESDSHEASMLPPDSPFIPPKDVVVEEKRPKLSVRKDLLDPNRSNVSLLNPLVEMSAEDKLNTTDGSNTGDCDKINNKREKKKKKSKKKDTVEVINLIEDTDDEISSGTNIDSVTMDDLSSKGLNSEDEVDKKDISRNSKISYDLDSKTATSMVIMKVKANKVLVVGCKDGFIRGYALGTPTTSFSTKIHNDTITALFYTNKYLITGSADCTVCLFSLREQVETQTLSVNAPVQSMDIKFETLIVGTKAGSIYSYTIKIVEVKKKVFVSLHPTKKVLSITNSSILAVKLAKEGVRQVLIVASRGEQITVRDASTGLLLRTFDWCDTVYCLQLYQETPLVYCGTNTKSVKVVNFIDGENAGDCIIGRSITQIEFVMSIMFAASYDGNIYVYDIEKKSLMATVMISRGIIQCLAIDGKNNLILVASTRGDLQQIPFPSSVIKHIKKLKIEKKKNMNKSETKQP